jgi:hypothetical protein
MLLAGWLRIIRTLRTVPSPFRERVRERERSQSRQHDHKPVTL